MAFCDPYQQCQDLDGRLLLNRTLHGPSLSDVTSDLSMQIGSVKIPAVKIFPFIQARFQQTWKAGDACVAPARSLIGLAPGEELVFENRMARQFDFSSVITRNQEFSSTFGIESHTENEDIQTSVDSTSVSTTDTDSVDLGPLGSWGSGGDADVVTIESVVERTVRTLSEVLVSVSATQVNGLTTEIASSTSISTETSLSRRIVNPLNDRTLELRFHPVFREFEVTTTFVLWTFGVLVRPLPLHFDREFVLRHPRFVGRVVPTHLEEPRAAAEGPVFAAAYARAPQIDQTQVAMNDLQSSPRRNTRRFLLYMRNSEGMGDFRRLAETALSSGRIAAGREPVQGAFALDQLKLKGADLEVPAVSVETLRRAVKLPEWQHKLVAALNEPAVLERFRKTFSFTTTVKLFMGTHLEAVPGSCVLLLAPAPDPGGGNG
jgi:hypothetical protein